MDQSQESVTVAHPSGLLEVPADAIMRFVSPMWGFEGHVEFALLPAARRGLWWFISTGDAPATFVLGDPFVAHADYVVDINDAERDELQLESESDALVLVMLAMPAAAGMPVTANFRAPLVFNVGRRVVKQVINRDDQFSLSQVVDLTSYPLEATPEAETSV